MVVMRDMNLYSFDLNLLVVFDALYRERSVTRAGAEIGLSQPSMSNALARLRKLCNDPLFVRTRAGMEPTPFAQQMAGPVRQGLETLRSGLEQPFGFNPAHSNRTFRLLMSDVVDITVLPRLMSRLERFAPGVSVLTIQVPRAQYSSILQNGEAELTVGNLPELENGFHQQRLYQDQYVCLARREHPQVQTSIGVRQYLEGSHVLVTASLGDTMIERELMTRGSRRRIALQVPHFLAATVIVMNSDLLVTVPRTAIDMLPIADRLQVLDLPFNLPRPTIRQFWHDRYHRDAANRWLRNQIAELFLQNSDGAIPRIA